MVATGLYAQDQELIAQGNASANRAVAVEEGTAATCDDPHLLAESATIRRFECNKLIRVPHVKVMARHATDRGAHEAWFCVHRCGFPSGTLNWI
jgi:hypothetical protein